MGAADNPASRKLPEPIEAAIVHLIEAAQSAEGYAADIHRVIDPCVERLRAVILPSLLPPQITPEIAEVLGLMLFRTCPVAHLYRAAGEAIPPKVEAEQAFVLFRFLHLALQHGPDWFEASCEDVRAARDAAAAKRLPQTKPTGASA